LVLYLWPRNPLGSITNHNYIQQLTETPYYAVELNARGEGKAEAENPFLITLGQNL